LIFFSLFLFLSQYILYFKMNIKSSQTLVKEALIEITTISPSQALEMSNNNECNLIDIRDTVELQKLGRIENSFHISRGC